MDLVHRSALIWPSFRRGTSVLFSSPVRKIHNLQARNIEQAGPLQLAQVRRWKSQCQPTDMGLTLSVKGKAGAPVAFLHFRVENVGQYATFCHFDSHGTKVSCNSFRGSRVHQCEQRIIALFKRLEPYVVFATHLQKPKIYIAGRTCISMYM